jgi:O-antigen/teichoic acid export membrane protein
MFLTYGERKAVLDKKILSEILRYSFIVGVASTSYYLYSKADILVLERFGYIEEIGYYEIINRIFELMFMPFVLLGQVMSPGITKFYVNKNFLRVRDRFKKLFITIVPIGLLLGFSFYFCMPFFLKYFFPQYYVSEMLISLSILSFLIPFKIWGTFQTQAFIIATGKAKIIAVSTLVGGILNVILNVVLIRLLGFTGVFWSTLFVHLSNILIVTVIYYTRIILTRNSVRL